MIVCKACGNRNADREEFCTSCGRYLAWSGERIEDAPEEIVPEETPEVAEIAARRPGIVERVRTAIGVPPHRPDVQPPPGGESLPVTGAGGVPGGDPGSGTTTAGPWVTVVPAALGAHSATPDANVETGGTAASPLLDTVAVPVVPSSGGADASLEHLESQASSEVLDVDVHSGGGTLASPVAVSALAEEQLGAAASTSVAEPAGLVTISSSVAGSAEVPAVTTRRPGEPVVHAVPVVAPQEPPGEPPSASNERGSILRRPTEVQGSSRVLRKRTVATDVGVGRTGPAPGDVFCQRCEQFNSPTRIFCRRCGEELHPELAPGESPKYTTLDFWQRHLHRDVQITSAGSRPGRWGKSTTGGGGQGLWIRIMTRGLAAMAGILIVLSFIGPAAQPIRDWYANVYRNLVNRVNVTYTQVFAIGANATSQIPAHPASYAVDDGSNTYWQTKPTPRDGAGQALVVVFASPTNIDRVGVLNGAGPTQQDFLKQTAPKEVELTFSGRNEHYAIREHLRDSRSFQRLDVKVKAATSMTMTILSVYPSPLKSKSVALTEIEFFQRT